MEQKCKKDHVKDVLEEVDDLSEKPPARTGIRRIPGRGCTVNSVQGCILEHSQEAALAIGNAPAVSSGMGKSKRWNVCGKIGSNPSHKDKPGGSFDSAWMSSDLSDINAICWQEDCDAKAPARYQVRTAGKARPSSVQQLEEPSPQPPGSAELTSTNDHGGAVAEDRANVSKKPAQKSGRQFLRQISKIVHKASPSNRADMKMQISGIIPSNVVRASKRECSQTLPPQDVETADFSGVCAVPLAATSDAAAGRRPASVAGMAPVRAASIQRPASVAAGEVNILKLDHPINPAHPNGPAQSWNSKLRALDAEAEDVKEKFSMRVEGGQTEGLAKRIIRKTKAVAYKQVVNVKPKLMDQVEKRLFGKKVYKNKWNLERKSAWET